MTEATIKNCGLAVMARFRYRLKIVAGVHERGIAQVRALVVDNRCRIAAAAFAKRMAGEVRGAELAPAMLCSFLFSFRGQG
jgi:hypothetical protein